MDEQQQPSFFENLINNFNDWFFLDGTLGRSIRSATNDFVRYLVIHYGDAFEAFSNFLLAALVWLEDLLDHTPVLIILAVVGLLAYAASRKTSLAVGMVLGLWFVGALGLWDQAMQTIAIITVAVVISVAIGIPVGVLAARSDRARALVNPVLDLMQTIPSFVYLIPAVMLFGLGKIPAVLATVIYATPPLIRLTDLGIRQVDREIVEASRAFGATRFQMLIGVQIPLALPSIMQGINQTMMMALAMVVIASMIGARGVGETVLIGLQRNDAGQGLIGGIAIVVLAIIFDRISQAAGLRAQKYRSVAH
ncbi:MAG: proline/glycine betaine ABC transporter permease [Pseudomonadota bacterium]